MRRSCALLLLTLIILLPIPASAAKRVAFVVGIDRYDNLEAGLQLKKAVNDASAIAETLQSLGYQVARSENVARRDFLRQWQLFLNRLEPGDETAFFFAGHGVEIDGQNFLLARDVPSVSPGEEEVLKAEGLAMGALLEQVRQRHPQVSLYILDACRENPFFDRRGRSVGGTRGLARMEPPSGTFIMFSAGSGETALDRLSDNDSNPNSIYTRTLLPRLKTPGKITDIARDVRRSVREIASGVAHVQTPAYYDEVVGDFCPAGCATESKTADVAASSPTADSAELQEQPKPSDAGDGADAGKRTAPAETTTAELTPGEPVTPSAPAPVPQAPARAPRSFEAPGQLVWTAAFSPDGRWLAAGIHDGRIGIWDVESGKLVRTLTGHKGYVKCVAFAPDNGLLASGGEDGTVRLWDSFAGKALRTLGKGEVVQSLAFSPDGRMLAAGHGNGLIDVWDVRSVKLLAGLKGDAYGVYTLAFSPDGKTLISAGALGTMFAWSTETKELLHKIAVPDYDYTNAVAFAPDGSRFTSGGDDKMLRQWSSAGEAIRSVPGKSDIDTLLYALNGRVILTGGDESVTVWDAESGALLHTVKTALVTDIALSPDGSHLAVVGNGIALHELGSDQMVKR